MLLLIRRLVGSRIIVCKMWDTIRGSFCMGGVFGMALARIWYLSFGVPDLWLF